jgi:drug/metabolite transporter (DMT)-like permease
MSVFPQKPALWQVWLILILGVMAVATSAPIIRVALASAATQGLGFSLFLAATRLVMASVFLVPAWRSLPVRQITGATWGYAIAAGCCLALHFATWITSLSFTSIAASTALVTTNPVWVALLSWLWFGRRPTGITVGGIAIALTGGMVIAWGGAQGSASGTAPLFGDALALMGSWMASLYFMLGREAQRRGLSIGQYVAIAYAVAAIVLLPLPPVFNISYLGYPPLVYGCILLMAILPQLIGHTVINWSVTQISPTIVTLAILFEPVGSSLMGWALFSEIPGRFVLLGGVILLMGVAISIIGEPRTPAPASKPDSVEPR